VKKKSILFVLIIICVNFTVLVISSCHKDENPVNPVDPPPTIVPDTVSKYIWYLYRIPLKAYNIYVADTNKVYVTSIYRSLSLFDGTAVMPYNLNDPEFKVQEVSGFGTDDIFVLGFYLINNNRLPVLKKITNNIITSFSIADTGVVIGDFIVAGVNQAWFCEETKSIIYYFNNGLINSYKIAESDTLKFGKFYLNKDNELYLFTIDDYTQPTGKFFTHKLINNNFILQKIDCWGNFPCNTIYIFRCNNDLLMSDNYYGNLKSFNGTDWVYHSISDSTPRFTKLGGVSKDSLVGFSSVNNKVYTYGNNTKWRKENNSPELSGDFYYTVANLELKSGNVYFTYTGYYDFLVVGKPNKH